MKIKKVEKDGKIAVLVSGGFGAGWSTWMDDEHAKVLLYHPEIVDLVLKEKKDLITEELCKKILGLENEKDSYVCVLGASDLDVEWIETGSSFEIDDYDGNESLHVIGNRNYRTA